MTGTVALGGIFATTVNNSHSHPRSNSHTHSPFTNHTVSPLHSHFARFPREKRESRIPLPMRTYTLNTFRRRLKTMGARRHGQEGGTCPPSPWKCCIVFLCISIYSKTLSRRIIYALFSLPVVCLKGTIHRPHQYSIPAPASWVTRPGLLICPPREKNHAGAHAENHRRRQNFH